MEISKLSIEQKQLRSRILEISYERKLSHLGSCLSAVDIIYAIYMNKKDDERFVLSNGHAGIALYAVLEIKGLLKDIGNLNIHPDRNPNVGIDVSTGSLGQGLPIALGMALANRNKNVYCLISDGECCEGSIWESIRIAEEQKIDNLKIVVNANGWEAYDPISLSLLLQRIFGFSYNMRIADGHNLEELSHSLNLQSLVTFAMTSVDQFPFLKGQDAHYYILKERDLELAHEAMSC